MFTMRVMLAAVAAGFAVLVGGSGLARAADEDGYIAELQAAGVPMLKGPAYALGDGYQVCAMLRSGASPDIVATRFNLIDATAGWVPLEIGAAQRHLCPDTLPK